MRPPLRHSLLTGQGLDLVHGQVVEGAEAVGHRAVGAVGSATLVVGGLQLALVAEVDVGAVGEEDVDRLVVQLVGIAVIGLGEVAGLGQDLKFRSHFHGELDIAEEGTLAAQLHQLLTTQVAVDADRLDVGAVAAAGDVGQLAGAAVDAGDHLGEDAVVHEDVLPTHDAGSGGGGLRSRGVGGPVAAAGSPDLVVAHHGHRLGGIAVHRALEADGRGVGAGHQTLGDRRAAGGHGGVGVDRQHQVAAGVGAADEGVVDAAGGGQVEHQRGAVQNALELDFDFRHAFDVLVQGEHTQFVGSFQIVVGGDGCALKATNAGVGARISATVWADSNSSDGVEYAIVCHGVLLDSGIGPMGLPQSSTPARVDRQTK